MEIATAPNAVYVRDSSLPLTAASLTFSSAAWRGFVAGIRAGHFDLKEGS